MFKHVEQMRKYAFRIMSKTYGGIARKTKQAMEDQYPLIRLVRLLCFEDENEALAACRHYNITVEESHATNPNSPSSSSQAIVYWKRSSFREPKDPEKGFVLTLKPRKMIRTIESKLNGATRLAVCRGEVSGEGAALSSIPVSPSGVSRKVAANVARTSTAPLALSAEQVEAQQQQTEEQAAKRRMEERRRLREEQKRKEEEKLQKDEAERKQKAEAERQVLLLKKEKEEEMRRKQAEEQEALKRKQVEEEQRRRLELEEAKRAAEAAAREEKLRREAEERRLAAEAAARKEQRRREAEEKLRQEELRRKQEEEERLERIRREQEEKRRLEQERIRLEQERLRQEQLRLKREREEQERIRREEEARRIAEAKEARMNQARKLLVWRRLRNKLDREIRKERTRQSLRRLDPTFTGDQPPLVNLASYSDATGVPGAIPTFDIAIDARTSLLPGIRVLDCLSRQAHPPINLSAMLRKALHSLPRNASSLSGNVMLAKVAVVLPRFDDGPKADAVQSLLHFWVGERLQYGNVMIDLPEGGRHSFEIRTVASNQDSGIANCDMALLVIPPFFGEFSHDMNSVVKFPDFQHNVPRTMLCLDNGTNQAYANVVNTLLSSVPEEVPFIQVGEKLRADLFELALEESCDTLLQSFVTASAEGRTRGALVRISVAQLASRCIRSALWRDGVHPDTNEEHAIMDRSRGVLVAMLAELKSLSAICRRGRWSSWPAFEFVSRGVVRNYFGDGLHLPAWKDSLTQSEVEPAVMELYKQLEGSSFRETIAIMTIGAPEHVKQDCRDMMAKRQFRRCFEYVLMWGESNHEPSADEAVVYLPKRRVSDVVEGCIRRLSLDDDDNNDYVLGKRFSEKLYVEEADENAFSVGLMQAIRSPAVLLEECSPRQEPVDSPSFDGSQPLAESSKTPDSNIMSPPLGVQTPATPSVGVQTPAALPESTDFLRGSKRLLDPEDASTCAKRRRDSPLSKNEKDSMAFTKKLEAMLHGETVSDIKVGDSKLADLLRNAPDIELPY